MTTLEQPTHNARLHALGNGLVPQCAALAGERINDILRTREKEKHHGDIHR